MDWWGSGVSLLLNIWYCILESCLVFSIGILSPFWLPRPLEEARHSLASCRRRVLARDQDDGDSSDQGRDVNATTGAEDLPDLAGRYLDLIAQAQAQGRSAASNGAPPLQRGPLARGCCGLPGAFFDASAYDEVVLTTDWEADGFLSACVVFAVFTAEARRAHAADGHERPYPLRTVIVGEGDSFEKACRVREALAAMRRAGVVPPGCSIDVLEGSPSLPPSGEWESSRPAARRTQAGRRGEGEDDEEHGERFWESFFGSFAVVLRGAATALLGHGWRRPWNREAGLARKRLRELLVVARRQRQRALVIALKPPRDLIKVFLDRDRVEWRGQGDEKKQEFDHVDLLVSGAFGGAFVGGGEGEENIFQPRPTGRGVDGLEAALSTGDVLEVMGKVKRVFVVQLDDLVGSYNFPRAISPDRTPVLAAAVAGARGALPSALRRVVAASNKRTLTGFPDKVAAMISAGRYANEELQSKAETIAAAAAAVAASAARLAELGACMADLIATDFEALETAGLSPGIHQAVFRSLDVRVSLSNAAAAWALACPDAVCWERFPFVGLDPSSGRVLPLKAKGPGGYKRRDEDVHDNKDLAVSYEDRDHEDWTRISSRDICEVRRGYNRESGKVTVSEVRSSYSNGKLTACIGNSGFREDGGGVAVVGTAGVAVSAFFATGFARWFERLEDQEAGYMEFAGFLVRVLDQMP